MFSRILIANRGEIACRVIETARRLGIETVAVHSDADRAARHVRMADIALPLGGGGDYLDIDAVIAAARAASADAIHPGYGFLSENPAFAAAVQAADMVFIGPPADAMRAMGLKDAAKTLMEKAGVPVVPGYHGADQDPERLAAAAADIGYPVLIKARAGGGGKGMRLVEHADDFAAALEGAVREGAGSFGDGHVLIEKYIAAPRHIEVQVFADSHGNVVHLFERDCTMQRRHQKVIEEAPAPGMTDPVRHAMCAAAVTAAQAIGYQGAGTIEFIADGSDRLREDGFWFMEMNTRLQVEHPVTEAITGIDLVEWQLRVAAGSPLPLMQDAISMNGHAVEARLYAENPRHDFMPAPGAVDSFVPGPGMRVDSGVEDGDIVTPLYDPMIAKMITHAPDRAAALDALATGLDATHFIGTVTNIDFLASLLRHPVVGAAGSDPAFDTGLIARDLAALVGEDVPDQNLLALAFAVTLPDPAAEGWRLWGQGSVRRHLRVGDHIMCRRVVFGPDGQLSLCADGDPNGPDGNGPDGDGPDRNGRDGHLAVTLDRLRRKAGEISAVIDGQLVTARVARAGASVSLLRGTARLVASVPDHRDRATTARNTDMVVAPMAGTVQQVDVAAGDRVAADDRLLVLAAMKMEYALTAPRDGVIATIACAAGDAVGDSAVLVQFEAEDE